MRSNVVFFLLLALLAVLVGTLALRGREPHAAPIAASAEPVASASASASGAPAVSSALPVTPSDPKPKLGRPLRVVGLGWDALAPGILANGGLAASDKGELAKAGLKTSLTAVDSAAKVEKALARGGADEDGADVAVMPLPTLVAGWERLRALNLAVFYVVAWSRGRETLVSKKKAPLAQLPAQGEVTVEGRAPAPETYLALFALDLAGVEPSRVELSDKTGLVTAHSKADDKREAKGNPPEIVLSTADASRLVAWVAVAQRSLVTSHPDALIAWTKAWHAGQASLDKDPASAARTIGALDDSPEPLVLLERMGELAPVSLAENAELAGLSGRGAVTLESAFDRAWRIWRDARLLSTPPPERAPTIDLVVAGLARAEPKLLDKALPAPGEKRKARPTRESVLLTRHIPGKKLDDETQEAIVAEIGSVAGIFHRSPLRVTLHGTSAKKIQETIDLAVDRYALSAERIDPGKAAARVGSVAAIEIIQAR